MMITRKTRVTSGLLAVIMMITMLAAFVLPATAEAANPYDQYETINGTGLVPADDLTNILEAELSDNKLTETAYQVDSKEGIFRIRELVFGSVYGYDEGAVPPCSLEGIKFYQTADIDMEWEPFTGIGAMGGDVNAPFSGIFDGNGFVIENLYIISNGKAATGIGLFGHTRGASLMNIGIASGLVIGRNTVGGIVGSADEGTTVSNCWNAATVIGGGNAGVGGIAGAAMGDNVYFYNCYNLGLVFNHEDTAAGIVGKLSGSLQGAVNCYNAGEIVTGFNGYNAEMNPYGVIVNADFSMANANKNNYYITGRGKLGSVAEQKAAGATLAGGIELVGSDDATAVAPGAISGLAAKLNKTGLTVGLVGGYTVKFEQSDVGYPVLAYYDGQDLAVKRVAHTATNVNGAATWVNGSAIFKTLFNNRDGGFTSATSSKLSDLKIGTANDLFIYGIITSFINMTVWGNGNVTLTDDIDMNDLDLAPVKWYVPISSGVSETIGYKGTFSGKSHVIYNWAAYSAIVGHSNGNAALFSTVFSATIQDLGMIDAEIKLERIWMPTSKRYFYPAVMVDRVEGTITLNNCFATGTMSGHDINQNNQAGLVSTPYGAVYLKDCWCDVSVYDTYSGNRKELLVGNGDIDLTQEYVNSYFIGDGIPTGHSSTNYTKDLQTWLELDSTDGSLVARLNDLMTQKYALKNNKTVFAADAYAGTYSLTINKKIGNYVYKTDVSYIDATTVMDLPKFTGYELESYSEAIMPNFETNVFAMPAENAELNYVATVPDWAIIENLIDELDAFVATGHVETLEKESVIYEFVDKLKGAYARKDSWTKEEAIARIAAYAEEYVNLDMSFKEDLEYPVYPLMRFYEPGASTVWGIKSAEDWLAAIKINQEDKDKFSDITIHFLNDVDMQGAEMAPLGTEYAFAGDIDGHGHSIKNVNITQNPAVSPYAGLIGYGNGGGQVIQNLGIASGTVTMKGTLEGKETYAGLFMGRGTSDITFANCWTAAKLVTDITAKEVDASAFGRNTGLLRIINCFNIGVMDVKCSGTIRCNGFFDWTYGEARIYNGFSTAQGASYLYAVRSANISKDLYEKMNAEQLRNVYVSGAASITNSSSNDKYLTNVTVLDDLDLNELAWSLNNNYDTTYDDEYDRQYYTVKDGQICFCTEMEQPVRVNVKGGNSFFGYPSDRIELGNLFPVGNPTFKVAESYAATIDANSILTINALPNGMEINVDATFAGGLDYAELTDAINSFADVENLDQYTSFESSIPLSDLLATVKSKTYATQDEVDQDAALLKSYFYGCSITEYEAHPNEENYTVSNLKELEYLSEIKTKLTVDQTVYILNDIDATGWTKDTYPDVNGDVNNMNGLVASLDGDNSNSGDCSVISGIKISYKEIGIVSWLGTYAGRAIRDLVFKDCKTQPDENNYTAFLLSATGANTLFENLTLDNVTNDTTGRTSGNNRPSILIGNGTHAITISGLTIKNCTINSGYATGNTGMVIGRANKAGIVIKNCYLYNNTIKGKSSAGMSAFAGEISQDITIENVGVFNSNFANSHNAVMAGAVTGTAKVTAKNLIVKGNDATTNDAIFCGHTTAATGTGNVVATNVFTDCAKILHDPHATGKTINATNGAAKITSGEATWTINASGAEKTWAMVNGEPVFSDTGITYKVTFDFEASDDQYLYTDSEGKLIGLTNDLKSKSWEGYTDLTAAVFTADTVIKQAACAHNYVYTNLNNGTHRVVCTTTNGCGRNEIVDCSLEYRQSAGSVSHEQYCPDCGYSTTVECNKVYTHIYGTYETASKHMEACADCPYSAEKACTFTAEFVPHTDIAKGYTRYTCECGYFYEVEEAEKSHVWAPTGKVIKEAGYGVAGVEEFKCTVCSACEYREIAALTGTGINLEMPKTAQRGETIEVKVQLTNNPGIAGMNLSLNFDANVLALDGVEDHRIFGMFIANDKLTDGKVILTYLNNGDLLAADTEGKALTTLKFKVLDDAAYATTAIEADLIVNNSTETGAVNFRGEAVAVGAGKAVVEIVNHLWGDVDANGSVEINDAQMILQWRVGQDVPADLRAADVDRNGEVGIADALLLLQYLNGKVEWDPYGETKEPA